MADFNAVFGELKQGVIDLVQQQAKDYAQQAQSDGQAFLDALKADLEVWTKQLADGELSKADFEFLVRGTQSLAEMKAMTQAGIAAARVDRMRSALVDLVINSVSKLV